MKGRIFWFPLWFEVVLRLVHAGVLGYAAWLFHVRLRDHLTAGLFLVLAVLVLAGLYLLRPILVVDLEEGSRVDLRVRRK
ncbi:MAG: hypothetical protein L3J76_04710 [Candidatus Hydrothermae bacterium]|nr:hypothetical protein [Candidatus Hydrothermae bacterium]